MDAGAHAGPREVPGGCCQPEGPLPGRDRREDPQGGRSWGSWRAWEESPAVAGVDGDGGLALVAWGQGMPRRVSAGAGLGA